jgi:hypothetical protein
VRRARFVAAARREFLAEVVYYNKERADLGARSTAAGLTIGAATLIGRTSASMRDSDGFGSIAAMVKKYYKPTAATGRAARRARRLPPT